MICCWVLLCIKSGFFVKWELARGCCKSVWRMKTTRMLSVLQKYLLFSVYSRAEFRHSLHKATSLIIAWRINIFNILKFLILTNAAIVVEKLRFAIIFLVGVSGPHFKAKYSSRQCHLFMNYWRKSFVQNVCSYFLDTVVQFSVITNVMFHLERFLSVVFSLDSLEIQGSANDFYELREPSSW